ncbi:MAG: flavodoxin-dependent (E)-4-hydroxy-3-methylbut-2-enyl-diphosphate synthase [Oscillospiraceae bacterium]|jgi:(E)-4-hydroxy-3-methylbut-2-enyl-diphosphate synthase|nr:flavodoxin-dependent (E)-4-hydroxy-3-methylbut-2-enyl-diphosphate synthase [Oscillospiraceae bacterium]
MAAREKTRRIHVGPVAVGGGAPVSVQSMANTDTRDAAATLAQIERLRAAGCEIVRVALPDADCVKPLAAICAASPLPVVADIHFDYRLALDAVAAGAAKIRINPGNIGAPERVRAVADACRAAGLPIRVGVNGGSLPRETLAKHGGVTAAGMAEAALAQVALLHTFDFEDICVALKASDAALTVAACRVFAAQSDLPLHIGVTEAGTAYHGIVKSAVGLGALLLDGLGDTLRVSLTADPVEEVRAGLAILKGAGLRQKGVNLISCPTCGRCRVDLPALAAEVERRLAGVEKPLTVAVMGCAVNGPGEARHADAGVAGGDGEGLLFCRGAIVGKVPQARIADELVRLVEALAADS